MLRATFGSWLASTSRADPRFSQEPSNRRPEETLRLPGVLRRTAFDRGGNR